MSWLAFGVWQNFSVLLGEQVPTLASTLLPGFVVLAAVIGLLRAAWLYVFKREVYDAAARGKVSAPTLAAPAASPASLYPAREAGY